MDIVFIRDLEIETIIGIFDWEREVRQTIRINLDMANDISKAAKSDEIADALNYKAVADRLVEFIAASEFFLIETMAEEIAQIVMQEFSVPWLKLELHKLGAIEAAKSVGVIIERGSR